MTMRNSNDVSLVTKNKNSHKSLQKEHSVRQINVHTNWTIIQLIKMVISKELLLEHIRTPLYKNAYYLILSAAITSVFGFVFWIIAAKLYEPAAVGMTSALISVSNLLALFSELGLAIGLIRFLPGAGKNANGMINTCFSLCGLSSLVFALFFLAGLGFWSPSLLLVRQQPVFFVAFVVFALVSALTPLVNDVFLAKRSTGFITIMAILSKSLNIALVIIFAVIFSTAFGIFISTVIAMSTALLIAIFWFLPKVQEGYRPFPAIQRKVLNDIGRYSLGNYIARVFLQIPPLVFPIMVVNLLGTEMNAYFYIAWSFISILQVIPSSISNSLFAEGSNQEELFQVNIVKSLKLIFLVLLPAILVFLVLADKILLLFGHLYSKNGTLLLQIISVSVIPWSINYVYITIGRVRKHIKSIILASCGMTSIALILGYLLILKMDLIGIGIGWALGQTVVAIPVALSFFTHKDLDNLK